MFDVHTFSVNIEARFPASELIYLVLSWSEVY